MNPMITCDEVMRQLWDFLDGELTPDRMLAIEAHLATCERCLPHVQFERAFLDAVARVMRQNPVPAHGMAHRVREALRGEGFSLT